MGCILPLERQIGMNRAAVHTESIAICYLAISLELGQP